MHNILTKNTLYAILYSINFRSKCAIHRENYIIRKAGGNTNEKKILSGVIALSLPTACAVNSSTSAATTAPAETALAEEVTEPDGTELPPYKASPGSPYIPIPDLSGFKLTAPFVYGAGKPEVKGDS